MGILKGEFNNEDLSAYGYTDSIDENSDEKVGGKFNTTDKSLKGNAGLYNEDLSEYIYGKLNKEVELQLYRGKTTKDISVLVDNDNCIISATLVPFEYLYYKESDWVKTPAYYKLVIPYSVHKCLNARLADMGLKRPADENDPTDKMGYENNMPEWKLLSNDSIVIKSDDPVDCRVLIKGDR